jgi:hypothetical protein
MAIEPAFDGRGSCHKLGPVPSPARVGAWLLPALPAGFVPNSTQERLMVARDPGGIGPTPTDVELVHES